MGVIRDGKVSGFLPAKEAFAVHYPGYPSSTERAVETLGGTEGIIKARSLKSNKLELCFRPEDPHAHPAFGGLRPCNNLLLKISKKRSCNASTARLSDRSISVASTNKEVEGQASEEEETSLCAEIMARIPEAYHFEGMVDYQHVVAVHADIARRKKRNYMEMEEPRYEKAGFMDLDQEEVMILLPPLFAPKDMPENLVLRQPTPSIQKKRQEHNYPVINIEPALAIDFYVKEIPKKVSWEQAIAQGSEHWKWQMVVSKLFDERPIWPKESLIERLLDKGLKFSTQMLKRLLLGVAYYFSGGPFQRFWIKKGYDPRKDSESRIYQKIDYRVHPPLKSYCDASTSQGLKHRWEDLCSFRVFPYKCQTSLQLFELADDYIQQEIRKPPNQTTCTVSIEYETGWFSRHTIDTLRLSMEVKFMSVYPRTGAEKLLKVTYEKFEKSKRACIYKDVSKLDHEEEQPFSEEVVNNKDDGKESNCDVDEDDGNEDDIDEDELHEELDLAGKEADIVLQSDSYMENNSRSYLQELFDSFPSIIGGVDKMQDAETSDGEYQIYEQDSDDNDSGNDDE
ncbi:general transcription factor 3C polypeptide 5-like isoform X2 [Tripterygium wilfordii]|uniref:general transcription factor 3C polypeptide 5-like isoform X2 n=1 Tax=Tripterygium wilfordii TaxID=458696 RepID=UPI0018F8283D|nr:general transcription factor 3C polypeptide 5-like isoform X2 [Tripterygium wilfordii]